MQAAWPRPGSRASTPTPPRSPRPASTPSQAGVDVRFAQPHEVATGGADLSASARSTSCWCSRPSTTWRPGRRAQRRPGRPRARRDRRRRRRGRGRGVHRPRRRHRADDVRLERQPLPPGLDGRGRLGRRSAPPSGPSPWPRSPPGPGSPPATSSTSTPASSASTAWPRDHAARDPPPRSSNDDHDRSRPPAPAPPAPADRDGPQPGPGRRLPRRPGRSAGSIPDEAERRRLLPRGVRRLRRRLRPPRRHPARRGRRRRRRRRCRPVGAAGRGAGQPRRRGRDGRALRRPGAPRPRPARAPCMEVFEAAHPEEPAWFLQFLGVDPALPGPGPRVPPAARRARRRRPQRRGRVPRGDLRAEPAPSTSATASAGSATCSSPTARPPTPCGATRWRDRGCAAPARPTKVRPVREGRQDDGDHRARGRRVVDLGDGPNAVDTAFLDGLNEALDRVEADEASTSAS